MRICDFIFFTFYLASLKFVGFPKFDLHQINGWPVAQQEPPRRAMAEANTEDVFEEDENNRRLDSFALVETEKLAVLLQRCFDCGSLANVRMVSKGGIIFTKHHCAKCGGYKFWRSNKNLSL